MLIIEGANLVRMEHFFFVFNSYSNNKKFISLYRLTDSIFQMDRGQHNGKKSMGRVAIWLLVVDDCYAALGDGGNVIFISPKNEMVVTIASSFMPSAKDRIELIRTHIMPLFK